MNVYSFNGEIQDKPLFTSIDNRAFLYADALFDTLIYKANTLIFLEEHYFRLLASMRQLRMEIPSYFTQEYWGKEIVKTIDINELSEVRVRTTVYRDALGLYTPNQNKVSILIQTTPLQKRKDEIAILGLYKDNLLNTNHIDNIKTTNRIINTLAGIYSKENHFDNCLLINHYKQVAEAISSNVFLVHKNIIRTPLLSSGCIDGVVRRKVIDFLKKNKEYQLREEVITPFEVQQAEEVFLTNSVAGIQSVKQYKKKKYENLVASYLREQICTI